MRIITSVFAILFALILTACGGTDSNNDSNNDSNSDGLSVIDSIYLELLRDEIPDLNHVEDDLIINLGSEICNAFDNGMSFREMVMAGMGSEFTASEQGAMIGASIGAYCPEYEYKLN